MFESTGWQLDEPEMDETSRFDVLAPTVVRPPPTLELELEPERPENEIDPEVDQVRDGGDGGDGPAAGQVGNGDG